MKIIAPLIQFYNPFLKNGINDGILSLFNEKESKLFKAIIKGKITTDKQAATLLYDGNPSSQSYAKFKQNLLNKLLQMVINFDNNKGSTHRQKWIKLNQDYLAFNIMTYSAMKQTGFALAKKLVVQADRLEVYHIGMDVCKQLASHMMVAEKNKREGQRYHQKYLEFKRKYELSNELIFYYSDLMLLAKKRNYNQILHDKACKIEPIARSLADRDVPQSMQFFYQIQYAKYASISEHRGVIENNLEALQYFESQPHEYKASKDLLKVQLVVAYLGIGEFEKAVEFVDVDVKDINDEKWIEKVSLKVRILFNLGNYKEVYSLVQEAIMSIKFKQSYSVAQWRFWIYKYYADLLNYYETGIPVNTRKIKNNITRLTSDKDGVNISLVIAELILKIQQKGLSIMYDYTEQISNYIKTHLKDSHNDRSAIFLKFMLLLPESEYDRMRFESKLADLQRQLEEVPATMTTKPDIEIVPYESLMNLILKQHVRKSESLLEPTRQVESSAGQAASDR